MRRAAYTLIELLAVIVILGLVTSVVGAAFMRAAQQDVVLETSHQLQQFEGEARRSASGDRVTLQRLNGSESVVTADGSVVRTLPVDPSVEVKWSGDDHTPLDRIDLDRNGRSQDVIVSISQGSRESRYRVSGISGEWMPLEQP